MSPGLYEDVNIHDGVSMMGDNQTAWAGYEWDNHRVAWNPGAGTPEDAYQPQQDNDADVLPNVYAFGSPHPDALHMAYCDGSVVSISYDIQPGVHRSQAHRMDGGEL